MLDDLGDGRVRDRRVPRPDDRSDDAVRIGPANPLVAADLDPDVVGHANEAPVRLFGLILASRTVEPRLPADAHQPSELASRMVGQGEGAIDAGDAGVPLAGQADLAQRNDDVGMLTCLVLAQAIDERGERGFVVRVVGRAGDDGGAH